LSQKNGKVEKDVVEMEKKDKTTLEMGKEGEDGQLVKTKSLNGGSPKQKTNVLGQLDNIIMKYKPNSTPKSHDIKIGEKFTQPISAHVRKDSDQELANILANVVFHSDSSLNHTGIKDASLNNLKKAGTPSGKNLHRIQGKSITEDPKNYPKTPQIPQKQQSVGFLEHMLGLSSNFVPHTLGKDLNYKKDEIIDKNRETDGENLKFLESPIVSIRENK
jgi:hypothetical protein